MPFCAKCDFSCATRFVRPLVPEKPNFMSIGESPGITELYTGEPFSGDAGGLLNWFYRDAGLIRYSGDRKYKTYLTNAIKCFPSRFNKATDDFSILKSQDITKRHIMACRTWLVREFERVQPKLVLTFGSVALQSVMNEMHGWKVTDRTGFFYYSEEFDCHVMPLLHPAATLRNWGYTDQTRVQLKQFARALREGPPKYKLGDYWHIRNINEAKNLFAQIKSSPWTTFDTETSSLKFWDRGEVILGCSFSWEDGKSAWLPFYDTGPDGRKEIWSEKQFAYIISELKTILESTEIGKVGQNSKFDINWFRRYDITTTNITWDTQQVHHLINENTPANLTYLTSYYDTNLPPYELEIKPHIKTVNKEKKYEFIPSDILGTYAAADTDATRMIAVKQMDILPKKKKRIYDVISTEISKYCAEMEWNGAKIDIPTISIRETEYEKRIKKENAALAELAKVDSVNVASPKQLQYLLFTRLRLKSIKKTKAGQPGTDAEVLDILQKKYKKRPRVVQILKKILDIRGMRKMKSTYLTGFRKIADEVGRLHTNYISTGTVTGRISSRSPNLQNIPRDPLFRSLFISGPNRKLLVSDYSQIEARLMAFLAGEEELIRKFADPDFDIHAYTASKILNKPVEQVTKEERSKIKSTVFGINYGRSNKSIAEEYGMDIEEVEMFVNGYFESYPKIAAFRKRQKQMARKNKVLVNAAGRERHFSGYLWASSDEMREAANVREEFGLSTWLTQSIMGGMDRQAMNFPIQSYAHDILSQAIGRIRKRIKKENLDAFVVLNVHDCCIADSAEDCAERVLTIFNEEMPVTKSLPNSDLTMTFGIDATIEDHWVQ